MSVKPTLPPFAQVSEALKQFESTRDLALFLNAFEMAVEHDIDRQQLHPIIKNYISTSTATLDDLRKILRWAELVEFKKNGPVATLPKTPYSTEFQALLEDAGRIGAAIRKRDREAEDHPYWFFRPAWQVKSALWRELFGEHDPAITIAQYAKHSFKSLSGFRKPLILDDGDILIVTSLVEHLKHCLCECENIEPKHLRPVLAAAMGAEHLLPGRLLNHNFPFEAVFRSATSFNGLPHWVAQYVLQFWSRSFEETYGNDLSHIDAPTKDSIFEQAQLVGAVLLGYVVDDDEVGANDLPKLDYISDRSFTQALHTIDWLNVELDIPHLRHLFSSILQATDRARIRQFGGQLPFSIYDASSLFEQANLEMWISQIASYTSDKYDDVIDRYSCTLSAECDLGYLRGKAGQSICRTALHLLSQDVRRVH
jgi:hypothetical protein